MEYSCGHIGRKQEILNFFQLPLPIQTAPKKVKLSANW